jgi:hypothetical protein
MVLTPVEILVETEFPVMADPPKVDTSAHATLEQTTTDP